MKVDKKILALLALNTIAAIPGEAAETKTDKLYNNVMKNIQSGKSNSENFKLIENILKQKNKELKDLYLQGNYIVKPEYLEWQIFFSGFYNEKNRGDNTLSNAKYYSDPQKASGDSTLDPSQTSLYGDTEINGKFKPYKHEQASEFIDLGVSLKIKGIEKNMSDINIDDIQPVMVNSSEISFGAPSSLSIPKINLAGFNPSSPKITTISFNPIPVLSLNGTGGGNGGITGFFPYGDQSGANSIISQMDITSGIITVKTDRLTGSTPGSWAYNNPGYYSYTLNNVTGAPSAGLVYDQRSTYNPGTGTYIYEEALLPAGVYTDSINTNPAGYSSSVQGVFKVIDNPVTRFGTPGGNVDDLTVTLEGDVPNAEFLEQILHYYEHYSGIPDPVSGMWKTYTLDEMETNGWITSTEKSELAAKFLDTTLGHTTADRQFQYVENNSTWNLKGSNVVAVNIQAHGGWNNANSSLMNKGKGKGMN